ncbi:MAG: hypothetical protein AAGF74_00465 [Pseudomonadota bacterium]
MSNTVKALVVLGLATLAAACSQQEEPAPVAPAPIVAEPVTGKF